MPYHTIPYHTIPYHTIPYHTIPYQSSGTATNGSRGRLIGGSEFRRNSRPAAPTLRWRPPRLSPPPSLQPHSDGPLYAPVVSIISLGSPCVIRFWRKQEEGASLRSPAVGAPTARHLTPESWLPGCGRAPGTATGGLPQPQAALGISLSADEQRRATHPALTPARRAAPPRAPARAGGAGGLPPAASLVLPRRSLLVFAGDAYESCLHGIEEAAFERLDCSVANRALFLDASVSAAAAAAPAAVAAAPGAAAGAAEAATAVEAKAAVKNGLAAVAAEQAGPPIANGSAGGGCSCSGAASSAVELPPSEAAAARPAATTAAPAWPPVWGGCGAGGAGNERLLPRTGERLSLTIRRVLKVHRGLRLPGAPR
jgi:hypothetical protein